MSWAAWRVGGHGSPVAGQHRPVLLSLVFAEMLELAHIFRLQHLYGLRGLGGALWPLGLRVAHLRGCGRLEASGGELRWPIVTARCGVLLPSCNLIEFGRDAAF